MHAGFTCSPTGRAGKRTSRVPSSLGCPLVLPAHSGSSCPFFPSGGLPSQSWQAQGSASCLRPTPNIAPSWAYLAIKGCGQRQRGHAPQPGSNGEETVVERMEGARGAGGTWHYGPLPIACLGVQLRIFTPSRATLPGWRKLYCPPPPCGLRPEALCNAKSEISQAVGRRDRR